MGIEITKRYIIITFSSIAALSAILIAVIKILQKKAKLQLPKVSPDQNLLLRASRNEEIGENNYLPATDLLNTYESQARHELRDAPADADNQKSYFLTEASSFVQLDGESSEFPSGNFTPLSHSSRKYLRQVSLEDSSRESEILQVQNKEGVSSNVPGKLSYNITERLEIAIGGVDNSRPESTPSSFGRSEGNNDTSDFEEVIKTLQDDGYYPTRSCSPDNIRDVIHSIADEPFNQSEEKIADLADEDSQSSRSSLHTSAISSPTSDELGDENDASEKNIYINIGNTDKIRNLTNQEKVGAESSDNAVLEQETEDIKTDIDQKNTQETKESSSVNNNDESSADEALKERNNNEEVASVSTDHSMQDADAKNEKQNDQAIPAQKAAEANNDDAIETTEDKIERIKKGLGGISEAQLEGVIAGLSAKLDVQLRCKENVTKENREKLEEFARSSKKIKQKVLEEMGYDKRELIKKIMIKGKKAELEYSRVYRDLNREVFQQIKRIDTILTDSLITHYGDEPTTELEDSEISESFDSFVFI